MRFITLIALFTPYVSLSAMDINTAQQPLNSIEAYHTRAANLFVVKPFEVLVLPRGIRFGKKYGSHAGACGDTCAVKGFSQKAIEVDGVLRPSESEFCLKAKMHECFFEVRAASDLSLKYKVYYGHTLDGLERIRGCACNFSLVMEPSDGTQNYKVELCGGGLYVKQASPLYLRGLEHKDFKHLGYLVINNCPMLYGTTCGALNSILKHLEYLTHLDLSHTKLDNTVIDARHGQLQKLKLTGSNCTTIKQLFMPRLYSLILDHSALTEINRDEITIRCPISAIGCTITTMHGTQEIGIELVESIFNYYNYRKESQD